MLLKRHIARIEDRPADTRQGFEHLDHGAIAVIRWLGANRIEFVLVGPVAAAIHGESGEQGPVAIVPAPYTRNLERLAHALDGARASNRREGAGITGESDTTPTKLTAEKLARGDLWTLRCGSYDIDIEGQPPGLASYQELLYEARSLELATGVTVEVASPEDIEHFAYVRRTGVAPEIRILRTAPA